MQPHSEKAVYVNNLGEEGDEREGRLRAELRSVGGFEE